MPGADLPEKPGQPNAFSASADFRKRTTSTITLKVFARSRLLAQESEYCLELLGESGFVSEERLASIKKETGELKGIFVTIVRNTKAKSKNPRL